MNIRYKYTIRSANRGVKSSIQAHFNYPKGRFRYPLGAKILFDIWDNETQRPTTDKSVIRKIEKHHPTIKNDILIINTLIKNLEASTDIWKSLKIQAREVLDLTDLKQYLNKNFKNIETKKKKLEYSLYLDDMLESFLNGITRGDILTKSKRYKVGTIKVYTTLLRSFKRIQDFYKTRFTIEDVNSDLADKWTDYQYKKRNSSISNVGKQHKHFKTVIKYNLVKITELDYINEKSGIPPILSKSSIDNVNNNLTKHFKYIVSAKTNIALTEIELKKLFDLGEDKLQKHMIAYRDVFLVGCYTALRYSDYKRIGPEHVKGDNIEIRTVKNPTDVKIPIRPELRHILNKYNNAMPKTHEQKMNLYIKKIAEIAKINNIESVTTWKRGVETIKRKFRYSLISTHTARRTAATLLHSEGVPIKFIMALTGHKSIRAFETYIKPDKETELKKLRTSKFFIGNTLSKVDETA